MTQRLRPYWPFIAAILATLLFFNRLAFTDLILARGDTFSYFYPYWDARNAALSAGRLPLWTPDLFMGAPLLANSQIGVFYPPNWLLVGFSAPDAVRISILLHVTWASLGAYYLARKGLGLGATPALVAGLLYGFGGHVGAHVEQINQLQGLSWLPWLFLALVLARRDSLRYGALLAAGLALQFFSGHSQMVFITVFGLGVYALAARQIRLIVTLALAGLVALVLVTPQLIPTLELAQNSVRGGGLTSQQAVAFSLSPFVVGRGLLPSFDSLLFGEFVAYGGVIGLSLLVVGALTWRQSGRGRALVIWGLIAFIGLTFAFGLYNPLYVGLTALPGFNFFRVPARWLALFALSSALLAGWGLQVLQSKIYTLRARDYAVILIVLAGLAGASFLAGRQSEDFIGPSLPTARTVVYWGMALAILLALSWRGWVHWLPLALLVELFAASLILAYNDLTPPDVYSGQRLTASQLRAFANQQSPPGRLLSISNLFFDPGDLATLEARYRGRGLDDLAVRHALVATKMQETLAANLPLTWNVPSIDGFDGGLLPTQHYADFSTLLLPPGEEPTRDGRLRELLAQEACRGACIPAARWLNLSGTRYLVTDKIFDLWHADVAYDTQFGRILAAGESDALRHVRPFESTALDVLYSAEPGSETLLSVQIAFDDGERAALTLAADSQTAALDDLQLARLPLGSARTPTDITLQAETPIIVRAVTLVDTRTGDFVQLTLGPWRRTLSSDIKLYENLDTLPRPFIVHAVQSAADSESALELMRQADFDPARQAVIIGEDVTLAPVSSANSTATIVKYEDERVEIVVETDAAGYLLLADAYYPGWGATVAGDPTPIQRADVLFRAVRVPAGSSTVVFEFNPFWLPGALIIGGVAWLAWLSVLAWGWQGRRRKG